MKFNALVIFAYGSVFLLLYFKDSCIGTVVIIYAIIHYTLYFTNKRR